MKTLTSRILATSTALALATSAAFAQTAQTAQPEASSARIQPHLVILTDALPKGGNATPEDFGRAFMAPQIHVTYSQDGRIKYEKCLTPSGDPTKTVCTTLGGSRGVEGYTQREIDVRLEGLLSASNTASWIKTSAALAAFVVSTVVVFKMVPAKSWENPPSKFAMESGTFGFRSMTNQEIREVSRISAEMYFVRQTLASRAWYSVVFSAVSIPTGYFIVGKEISKRYGYEAQADAYETLSEVSQHQTLVLEVESLRQTESDISLALMGIK